MVQRVLRHQRRDASETGAALARVSGLLRFDVALPHDELPRQLLVISREAWPRPVCRIVRLTGKGLKEPKQYLLRALFADHPLCADWEMR